LYNEHSQYALRESKTLAEIRTSNFDQLFIRTIKTDELRHSVLISVQGVQGHFVDLCIWVAPNFFYYEFADRSP